MTIRQFFDQFPDIDKALSGTGILAAALGISDFADGVGIIVGLATISMIVPRSILTWIELRNKTRKRQEPTDD
jgi:hypothetical protein